MVQASLPRPAAWRSAATRSRVYYSGDVNFAGSSSAVLTESIGTTNNTSATIDFESLPANGASLPEPLVISGFAFTSGGTSAGSALVIQGTGTSVWPGGWPSNVLMAAYWGSTIAIAKSGGGTFNLNSLDVDVYEQASSAVITGFSASVRRSSKQSISRSAPAFIKA